MIAVRPYRPEDRAACAAVFFRAVHEGASGHYDQAQREGWARSPEPDWTTPDPRAGQHTWVSESGGRITGFMALTPGGHLDMAFVLPEVMGQGHAAALYDALLAHARATGLKRLSVHASEYSRRFLGRRGWQTDRIERLAMRNGAGYDRIHMSLDLTTPESS